MHAYNYGALCIHTLYTSTYTRFTRHMHVIGTIPTPEDLKAHRDAPRHVRHRTGSCGFGRSSCRSIVPLNMEGFTLW